MARFRPEERCRLPREEDSPWQEEVSLRVERHQVEVGHRGLRAARLVRRETKRIVGHLTDT
jgi:hypothetical protein